MQHDVIYVLLSAATWSLRFAVKPRFRKNSCPVSRTPASASAFSFGVAISLHQNVRSSTDHQCHQSLAHNLCPGLPRTKHTSQDSMTRRMETGAANRNQHASACLTCTLSDALVRSSLTTATHPGGLDRPHCCENFQWICLRKRSVKTICVSNYSFAGKVPTPQPFKGSPRWTMVDVLLLLSEPREPCIVLMFWKLYQCRGPCFRPTSGLLSQRLPLKPRCFVTSFFLKLSVNLRP